MTNAPAVIKIRGTTMEGLMKKTILFTLLSLLFIQVGCESHHRDTDIQEQQERNEGYSDVRPKPVSEHEGGGNSGNK